MPTAHEIQKFFDRRRNVILVGTRSDGSPQITPVWFSYDGQHMYVSTTRRRAKYRIFKREPRVSVIVDDPEGRKFVSFRGTVEIREDIENLVPIFRGIHEKAGIVVPSDAEFLEFLRGDDRVLFVITPDGPIDSWTTDGFSVT